MDVTRRGFLTGGMAFGGLFATSALSAIADDDPSLWPFLRRWANIEAQTVATSEYTVWETMGPAAAVTGYLMDEGSEPSPDAREPAADIAELPGYWALP